MPTQENYQGQVGRYGIIRPIGEGGFADVYLARDLKLKRFVALKVLRFSLADASPEQKTAPNKAVSDEARIEERFYQEAEKIASLSHPNHHHIIEVYDYDRTERGNQMFHAPKPYLVMQLARNGSLKDLIKGEIFTPEQSLTYLTPIAHALDYVYEQGNVIHMDVKPENVLLGEDNLLLLSDFGLISIANSTNPTSYPLGTPPYSSPERYERGYIARRPADVFSLGVIAYLLLCGVKPHPETKWQDYDGLYKDPHYTLPTFASKGVNVDPRVEAVVRKALAFKASDRYTTCMGFIEALKQAINPPTPKIEVSKQTTSDLWRTGKVSCVATLEGHKDSVDSVTFSPDGKLLASANFDHTAKLWEPSTGRLLRTLEGHKDSVDSVTFSPDGKLLASASWDKTVKLWETATGKLIRTLEGYISYVGSVTFSPDGKLLASGSNFQTVRLWEVATGKLIRIIEGNSPYSVAFSPDGRLLASASDYQTVKLWETATGKLIRTLKGHTSYVSSVAFSPDGRLLASASDDKTVKLWRPE